jgi:hypothetical protein
MPATYRLIAKATLSMLRPCRTTWTSLRRKICNKVAAYVMSNPIDTTIIPTARINTTFQYLNNNAITTNIPTEQGNNEKF